MSELSNQLIQMRKSRKMTQSQVSHLIVERQTYSNYERGISMPDIQTYFKLTDRMGYNAADVVKAEQKNDKIRQHYRIFTKLRIEGGTEKEYSTLYDFAEKNRYYNNRSLSLYLLSKSLFHSKHPEIIPEINESDSLILKGYIDNLKDNFSVYDLRLIADYSFMVLSVTEMKALYQLMKPFDPYDYVESQHSYTIQIHKIYSNFTDFSLTHNDIPFAKELLKDQKNFMRIHPNLKFGLIRKVNIAFLNFKETGKIEELDTFLKVAETLDWIDDNKTSQSVLSQYKELKENGNQDNMHFTIE